MMKLPLKPYDVLYGTVQLYQVQMKKKWKCQFFSVFVLSVT